MKNITTYITENTNNSFTIYDLCDYLSWYFDLSNEYKNCEPFSNSSLDDIKDAFSEEEDYKKIAKHCNANVAVVKKTIKGLTNKDYTDIIDRLNNIIDEFWEDSDKYDLDELMDNDGDYMGLMATHYIDEPRCYLSEYISAGLSWAEDAYDNEELSDEEYEDAINHYNNFEI